MAEIREEMRRALASRRRELRLRPEQLAAAIGVHPSTLRKWENGTATHCHPSHHDAIRQFLAGTLPTPRLPVSRAQVDGGVTRLLNRIARTLRSCDPRQAAEFARRVDDLLRRALLSLLE